jgi:hypothetical protein
MVVRDLFEQPLTSSQDRESISVALSGRRQSQVSREGVATARFSKHDDSQWTQDYDP